MTIRSICFVVVSLMATSCAAPEASAPRFEVTFHAVAGPGAPLPGVTIKVAGRDIGTTGDDGLQHWSTRGRPGTRLPVEVSCPEGHRATDTPSSLNLRAARRLGDGTRQAIQFPIQCAPLRRTAVVVVSANGVAHLPVLLNGHEVARTDEHGVAHVRVNLPPDRLARIVLSTDARPELAPQNPELSVRVTDADELYIFDAPLTESHRPAQKPQRKRRRPQKVNRPVKIG